MADPFEDYFANVAKPEIAPGIGPVHFEDISPDDEAAIRKQLNLPPKAQVAAKAPVDPFEAHFSKKTWSGKAEDIKDVTTPAGYVGGDGFLDKLDPGNYVGNSAKSTLMRSALSMFHNAVPFPGFLKKETYKDPEGFFESISQPFPEAVTKTISQAIQGVENTFGHNAAKLISDTMAMAPAFVTSPIKGPKFMRELSGETKLRADIARPEFQQELKAADILKQIQEKDAASKAAAETAKGEAEVSQFDRFLDVTPGLRTAPEPAAPTQVGSMPSFRGQPAPADVAKPADILPNPPGRTGPFADIADAERAFADKQQAAKQVERVGDWTTFLGEQFVKAKSEGVPMVDLLNDERAKIKLQASDARAKLRDVNTSQADKQLIRKNLEDWANRDASIKNELANPTVDVATPSGTMETARPRLGLPFPENGPQSLEAAGERTYAPFREPGNEAQVRTQPRPPQGGGGEPPTVEARIAANDAEIARLRAEIAKGQVTKPEEGRIANENMQQMREPAENRGPVLPESPRGIHANLEENAQAEGRSTVEGQQQELRQRLSRAGQDPEEALRILRERELTNAPRGLQPTAESDVALSKMPSGGAQEGGVAEPDVAMTKNAVEPEERVPPEMQRDLEDARIQQDLANQRRAVETAKIPTEALRINDSGLEQGEGAKKNVVELPPAKDVKLTPELARQQLAYTLPETWAKMSGEERANLIKTAGVKDLVDRGFKIIRNERGSLTGGKSNPVESQIAKSAREELYSRIAEEARQTGESIADTATKLGVPADLLKNMQTTLAWTGKDGQKFNIKLNEPVIGDTGERPFKNSELINKVATGLADWRHYVKGTFAPELLPDGRTAAIEYAYNRNVAALQETRAKVQLGQLRELFNRMDDKGRRVLNNYETRKNDAIPPSIKPFFDWYKNETDKTYKAMQEFGDPANYIENWVGHLYKGKAAENADIIRQYYNQQKTILGSERFLKERKLPTYEVARHLGLEPKYENAADLMLATLNQEYKYVAMTNSIKTGLADGSLIMLGKDMETLPGMDYLRDSKDNWLTLDQRGQQSKFGEFRIIGHPDYVRILNNAVSPDVMPPGAKAISYPMNLFRKIKVALSAFHPQFIVSADLAEGAGSVGEMIGSALMGDKARVIEKFKESKRLLGQPSESYSAGSSVLDAIRRGDVDPAKNPDMEAFVMTGQRATSSGRYDPLKTDMNTKALLPLSQALGESIKEVGKGHEVMENLGNIIHGPIMDHFVRKTKTGAAIRLYQDGLAKLADERGGIENVTIADKKALGFDIGNHLNDMMGMVPREQLYFKTAMKNWLSFMMNFPGWNIGSGRLLASGVKGVVGNALNIPAELFSKSGKSFVDLSGKEQLAAKAIAGTLVVHGLQSALMNYYMTGEAPRDMKDFLAARTGKKDANGNDQRMWPVTYVNSWYSWMTHPIKAGINRGNFVGAEAYRILANMDYWGNHIYTPGANWSKQGVEIGAYAAKQALPFSLNNIVALQAQGVYTAKDAALTVLGWKPASRELNDTPAEIAAHEKFMSHLGANDPDEVSLIRDRSLLSQMIKNKDPDAKTKAVEMVKSNRLTMKELENMYKGIGTRAFYQEVQSIANRGDMDGLFEIWDKAKVGRDPRDVNDIKQVLGTKLVGMLGRSDTPERLSAMFKGRPFEQIGPELAKIREILAFRHPYAVNRSESERKAASE